MTRQIKNVNLQTFLLEDTPPSRRNALYMSASLTTGGPSRAWAAPRNVRSRVRLSRPRTHLRKSRRTRAFGDRGWMRLGLHKKSDCRSSSHGFFHDCNTRLHIWRPRCLYVCFVTPVHKELKVMASWPTDALANLAVFTGAWFPCH